MTPLDRPNLGTEMDGTEQPAIASSVTGTWIPSKGMAEPECWLPRAGSGPEKLRIDTLVEAGPHLALQALIRETLRGIDKIDGNIAYVLLLLHGASVIDSFIMAMGRPYCLGYMLALRRYKSRTSRGYRLRQHSVYPHLGAPSVESSDNKFAYVIRKSMFRGITAAATSPEGTAAVNNSNSRIDLAHLFATTKPTAAEALATKLAVIMALSHDDINMAARIQSFGMDSIVAVEIRNWLSKEVGADVAIFDILEARPWQLGGICYLEEQLSRIRAANKD
ncbi:hypothetical protein F4679DRAFT_590334 [Xylaria curta]|nr:hypothetical protein F4679DRAFT_590334 [Xylaria curta]